MKKHPYPDNPQNPYEDMLDLPHPVSSTHPQMPLANRAAQFSPFAALTGYDDQIQEAARLTDEKIELSQEEKVRLNEKLRLIQAQIDARSGDPAAKKPAVSVTCFRQDVRKTGGRYVTLSGIVKKIDPYTGSIIFYAPNGVSQGESIRIDDILKISFPIR